MTAGRRVFGVVAWPILLAVFALTTVRADESARIWTNTDGKTVKGVLKEKGDGWVKILIKSRIHRLKTSTLSEEDLQYIKNAKLYRTFKMDITTVKAQSSNSDRGIDIRKVKVVLENVQERKLKFRLIWVAQTNGRTKYGPHRIVDAEYDRDGEFFHQEKFYVKSVNGAQYKGYAARIVDEDGKTLAETASLVPFLRFLDEVEGQEDVREVRPQPGGGPGRLVPRGRLNR